MHDAQHDTGIAILPTSLHVYVRVYVCVYMSEIKIYTFLTAASDEGTWSASWSRRFTPGNHWVGKWMTPTAELDAVAKMELSACLLTYLLTHSLTPWCRILFEKPIVTQLFKKYPAFLWNPKVHYRVHKSPPLDPILSQLNPVRPIDTYSLRSILMSSSHLRLGLPSGHLLQGLPTKTL
jgi:hypothetical protein